MSLSARFKTIADVFNTSKWRHQLVEPLIGIVIALVALAGFVAGRYSVSRDETPPVVIAAPRMVSTETALFVETAKEPRKESVKAPAKANVMLVSDKETLPVSASKNGSVFYFSWCTGGKRIKEENRVLFKNAAAAVAAGYRQAVHCK